MSNDRAKLNFRMLVGTGEQRRPNESPRRRTSAAWRRYLVTAVVVAICVLLSWECRAMGLANANIVMIFMAGVVFIAARFGHGPAVAAAVLGVLAFDYLFVDPIFSIALSDTQYVVDLGVMTGIGLLISGLTDRLQRQLEASQQQERRTSQLYQMTRQLGQLAGTEPLVHSAGQQLTEVFAGDVVLYLCQPDGSVESVFGRDTFVAKDRVNALAARWVAENNQAAGLGTQSIPEATALFVPMIGSQRTMGVLGVRTNDPQRLFDSEERRMLEAYANLIALSIERDQSLREAQQAQIQVQSEQLRNALLSAVSHDLRTPLAMIAVTASSLLEGSTEQRGPFQREMLQTVVEQSQRLSRQVDNLLDMARLNSGADVLNREWEVLEELVGVSLARLCRELQAYTVRVEIPGDFPLLWVADDLLEHMFVNLLENAIRYTPPGSQIEIGATRCGERAIIRVADNGPGLPPGSELRVFDKFFRGKTVVADGQRGIGLGLAICQGIIHAHGGQITAANRPQGGAEFTISLPCPQESPRVTLDEISAPAES